MKAVCTRSTLSHLRNVTDIIVVLSSKKSQQHKEEIVLFNSQNSSLGNGIFGRYSQKFRAKEPNGTLRARKAFSLEADNILHTKAAVWEGLAVSPPVSGCWSSKD
ncbi:hypothetical protein TNIN_169271 [Trichonephila inaurata madagascariensis]|uniref:Uncharacterized protein n=1 Tax=Trichonephila inaurata madagascariensis TaxID=2747483 RepID=A0A8X6J8J6_9ARAC|nr:hypothetical protein TNIN_169271 [Trichonephila inaurata madagascariensis]